uniref:Methylcrotonoyl-CoA carboxylase subunit alpha, mitochondrial n=1 Tax=Plectus sambesii TaxID=2011161 RepID=A0A914WU61_9BILA
MSLTRVVHLRIAGCSRLRLQQARWRHNPAEFRPISKLLIANRGEIACRVMKTARKLGIRTVAVYSEADRAALHVATADEAYCIGPPPSAESYLRMDKILAVAKKAGAQAIHPGYGFLSENAVFADKCQAENVIFVGPPSSAIRDMGIKNTAKQIMSDAGVPVVLGYHGTEQSDERLRQESQRIGYPVMLKAVYGGGGKGMRIARSEAEFAQQLESARREAKKSFGNDEMLVEKFVENPRHVEVQVFGDSHDNYVYLYERDCSIQRRHQKVIEEAPAPLISPETRRYLGEAAVKAARAVHYVGAGTVEFIMDSSEKFFFMEMNTRLQVEHCVSEMITGTDLVEWQLRVAQGEKLPIIDQSQIKLNGHAIESRIYAEDPDNNFMPGAGPLPYLRFPEVGPSVRVETGVSQGDQVSVHYDPMIAKIVVWGPDRLSAVRRLETTLAETHVVGLKTNVNFVRSVLTHPKFQAGKVYTDFIPDHERDLFPEKKKPSFAVLAEASVAFVLHELAEVIGQPDFNPNDPFSKLDGFRVNLPNKQMIRLGDQSVAVDFNKDGSYTVHIDGHSELVTVNTLSGRSDSAQQSFEYCVEVAGESRKVTAVWIADNVTLFTQDGQFEFERPAPKWVRESVGGAVASGGMIAPMPGVIEKINVKAGDQVKQGDALVIMVAMKMEYVIRASKDGVVQAVLCTEGGQVAKNST